MNIYVLNSLDLLKDKEWNPLVFSVLASIRNVPMTATRMKKVIRDTLGYSYSAASKHFSRIADMDMLEKVGSNEFRIRNIRKGESYVTVNSDVVEYFIKEFPKDKMAFKIYLFLLVRYRMSKEEFSYNLKFAIGGTSAFAILPSIGFSAKSDFSRNKATEILDKLRKDGIIQFNDPKPEYNGIGVLIGNYRTLTSIR